MASLPETITNVTETVDDILHVFEEKQIQEEYKKSHSFYSFLLHFTLNVIYVVEELMKDTSGSIKKYIVILYLIDELFLLISGPFSIKKLEVTK